MVDAEQTVDTVGRYLQLGFETSLVRIGEDSAAEGRLRGCHDSPAVHIPMC